MSRTWNSYDFRNALEEFDLNNFENIFIHSNLSYLGKPQYGLASEIVLDNLEKSLPQNSNLLLPAFTYSFGRGSVFDPKSTENLSEMGALSSLAFKRGYHRSIDPMFSILGLGANVKNLLSLGERSSFGEASTFGKLLSSKTALLLICVGGGSTLLHEIERIEGVSYRFEKKFQGHTVNSYGELTPLDWRSYVRDYDSEVDSTPSFEKLTSYLVSSNTLKIAKLGRGYLGFIDVELLKRDVIDLLSLNPHALIKGSGGKL